MENRYIITMDIKKGTILNARFKQGDTDSSVLEVKLIDNGVFVDITGQDIEFNFLRPDGIITTQDSTNGVSILDAMNGKFQCILKNSTLSVAGNARCDIIFAKDGKELSTKTFNFTIDDKINSGLLSIASINAKIVEWQTEIDEIKEAYENATHENSLLEVVNARKGEVDLATKIGKIDSSLSESMQQISEKATKLELQAVASGAPRSGYATIADLTIGIPGGNIYPYLTNNGQWNTWNGTNWVARGVYHDVLTSPSVIKAKTFVNADARFEEIEGDSYLPATNILKNSNLATGTTYEWDSVSSTSVVTDGVLVNTASGSASQPYVTPHTSIPVDLTHKYYTKAKVMVSSALCQGVSIAYVGTTGGTLTSIYTKLAPLFLNEWFDISAIALFPSNSTGNVKMLIKHIYFPSANALNNVLKVQNAITIDLTATFGVGNEPTVAEMDKLLSYFPNSWFDGTINMMKNRYLLDRVIKIPNASIYKDKYVSFLGDSLTTYDGWNPVGYAPAYSDLDVNNFGVTSVEQTWWKKLINALEMKLCVNNAYGASLLSRDATNAGCGDRCVNLHTATHNPDVIIVFMGINDFYNNVLIGDYDGSQEYPTDVSYFKNAITITINKINEKYPNAELHFCTIPCVAGINYATYPVKNNLLMTLDKYNQAIIDMCLLAHCKVIKLHECGINFKNLVSMAKDKCHPYPKGHSLLATTAIRTMDATRVVKYID